MKSNSITIINVTNPSHLEYMGKTTATSVHDIDVTSDGKYAYTIGYKTPTLAIYNVSNKSSPAASPAILNITSIVGETGMYLDLFDNDNYLVVTTQTYIRLYNVTNKTAYQLDLIGSAFNTGLDTGEQFWHPQVYQNTLYVTEMNSTRANRSGINVYDISNKTSPSYTGNLSYTYRGPEVHVFQHSNGYTYLAYIGIKGQYMNGYLILYNISDGGPQNPTYLSTTLITDDQTNLPYYGMAIKNDYLVVHKQNQTDAKKAGVWVYSLKNINTPTRVFTVNRTTSPENYLYSCHRIEFDRNPKNNDAVYVVCEKPDCMIAFKITWSTLLNQQNLPPDQPSKPSGVTSGEIGQEYTYTTSTIDPNGDQIYYLWDWGDGNMSGWLGPYYADATFEATHIWKVKNNYNIKVKAKDVYGKESAWSESLSIKMRLFYANPLQHFLEVFIQRFPNMYLILQRFMIGY